MKRVWRLVKDGLVVHGVGVSGRVLDGAYKVAFEADGQG